MGRTLHLRDIVALLGLLWLLVPTTLTAQSDSAPAAPIEDWLTSADRQEFAWKIHLSSPHLTYQQRYLVHVRASIPSDAMKNFGGQQVLHFVVKVADESGHWFHGDTYRDFPVPVGLASSQEIQFDTGLYLRRGNYTVAVIGYGNDLRHYNLARQPIRIGPMKNDPLPQLDRDLPAVEFITEFPGDSLIAALPGRSPRMPRYIPIGPENDQTWPLGHGKELLPVSNQRAVQLDLVLDFSDWSDPNMKTKPSPQAYRQSVGRVLQIGSVLSHLTFQSGCVRVNVLDTSKMRTILRQGDATNLDWGKVQAAVMKLDQNTVDIHAMDRGSQKAEFLEKFMGLIAESPTCAPEGEHGLHLIMVAPAGKLQLPSWKQTDGLQAKSGCDCRYSYLKPVESISDIGPDDIQSLLKPLRPVAYDASDPADFRKNLSRIIADLEAVSSQTPIPKP